MSNTVYIVHCIDTEGPLYEDPNVPFDMIKSIFQIDIEPTKENLTKLQQGVFDLNGRETAVANLLDPHKITTLGSWNEIDDMLEIVTSKQFKNELLDSTGNGWVYNWFCVDHVGFTGLNPRRRDSGYHNIFDHYNRIKKAEDLVQFHFHPIPFSGNFNDSGTQYWGSNLTQILARRVIERKWFPSCFRPGFHTERPDSHWFLEQWIPFDYANQAVKRQDTDQPDLSDGRFGDWRRATTEWEVYHPSHDDYQQKGSCRRWIARCLNMHSRLREINQEDIEEAFIRALNKEDTLLAFTNHDYKNMEFEVGKVRDMIRIVAQKYPTVKFQYVNALEGMRKVLKLTPEPMNLQLTYDEMPGEIGRITVSSNKNIFGPQPFLAIRTLEGKYYWDNFDFQGNEKWTYTFDGNTLYSRSIDKIGIAANSRAGVTEVMLFDVKTKQIEKAVYNI